MNSKRQWNIADPMIESGNTTAYRQSSLAQTSTRHDEVPNRIDVALEFNMREGVDQLSNSYLVATCCAADGLHRADEQTTYDEQITELEDSFCVASHQTAVD